MFLPRSYFYPKWLKIGTGGLGSCFRESVMYFKEAAAVVSWMLCVYLYMLVSVYSCLNLSIAVCVCLCICVCLCMLP